MKVKVNIIKNRIELNESPFAMRCIDTMKAKV